MLVSYPKTTGRIEALDKATAAAKAGLVQVGMLDSSHYASLQPGYFVVFAVSTAHRRMRTRPFRPFARRVSAARYSRQIAR